MLNRLLAESIGRIQNRFFTVGTGSNEPMGAVTASGQGRIGAAGQVSTVLHDDLQALKYSVDPSYRLRSVWMMRDATAQAISQLKDTANQPLLIPSRDGDGEDVLLGHKVVINPSMAAMAANAKSIVFGDFKEFAVRDVQDLVVLRLEQRYAEFAQVGFIAFLRSDSRLLNASAIKHYAHPAA